MNIPLNAIDIAGLIIGIIVLAFNIKMITYINKSSKEDKLLLALYKSNINYGDGSENSLQQQERWTKIKVSHKRKIYLIEAGVKPEYAKTKETKKLTNDQLYTLAALRKISN